MGETGIMDTVEKQISAVRIFLDDTDKLRYSDVFLEDCLSQCELIKVYYAAQLLKEELPKDSVELLLEGNKMLKEIHSMIDGKHRKSVAELEEQLELLQK